jgi:hypothetical protein
MSQHVNIKKRCVALQNLDDNTGINITWENNSDIIKPISKENLDFCNLKQYKARYDKIVAVYYIKECKLK